MTTLIHKFWTHVFQSPQSTAMRIAESNLEGGTTLLDLCWSDYGTAVAAVANYLRKQGVKRGDRVAILAWNCPEWVFADLAIQTLGAVTVPIYPNSSAEATNYILENADARITFSNDPKQIEKVKFGKAHEFDAVTDGRSFMSWLMPELDLSKLYVPGVPAEVREELKRIKFQHEILDCEFLGISADDLATIIYTSGSSGTPKGCMISHGNIGAALSGLSKVVELDPDSDFYLSYLPLAHVYERIDGMYMCIWNRVPVGFSPIDKMQQNLNVFRPTMLCGVPAVWEKMRNGLYEPKAGVLKLLNRMGAWKTLLDFAVSRKPGSTMHWVFDKLVFKKVRARLGGRLRLLISGGAPISPAVLQFFAAIGHNVEDPSYTLECLEGYGATETTGGITTNRPSRGAKPGDKPCNKIGTVGLPVDGVTLRIVKEVGEEEIEGGEILLGGAQIFKGYWRMDEQTREAFAEDGCFKTGDLGVVDADGFLSIKGRKNGMYKTSQGKYVSREKLELAFKPFPIVQYILPVAHGRKYTTALFWVNQELAASLCGRPVPAGVDATEFYSTQPEVLKALEEAIAAANKGLEHWETVGDYRVVKIAATIANGIVTETMKLRSKVLLKRFEKEIDEMYANPTRDKKSAGN